MGLYTWAQYTPTQTKNHRGVMYVFQNVLKSRIQLSPIYLFFFKARGDMQNTAVHARIVLQQRENHMHHRRNGRTLKSLNLPTIPAGRVAAAMYHT